MQVQQRVDLVSCLARNIIPLRKCAFANLSDRLYRVCIENPGNYCLIGNALEDAVSAFDGFDRESCRVALVARSATVPENLSFHNLVGAQKNVQTLLSYDLASCLLPD